MARLKPKRHLSGPKPKKVGEQKTRTHFKYHFKVGNKILHGGITKDIDRREKEHKQNSPDGRIIQVGRRTTEEAARKWKKDKGHR